MPAERDQTALSPDQERLIRELRGSRGFEYLLQVMLAIRDHQERNTLVDNSLEMANQFVSDLEESGRINFYPEILSFHTTLPQRISQDPEAVYSQVCELYEQTVRPQN